MSGSRPPTELADPYVRDALAFNATFAPDWGIDYQWVVRHAKEQYAAADAAFRQVDEKAGALVGYLGGASGLIAVGAVAGTSGGQIDARLVLTAVPAFAFAVAAVACATIARRPYGFAMPPTAADAAGRAS